MGTCVVLTTDKKYSDEYEHILASIFSDSLDLFLAHGKEAESWEDAMDMYCIMLDVTGAKPGAFCNTTSHECESLDSVIEFAEQWCELKGIEQDIEVVGV